MNKRIFKKIVKIFIVTIGVVLGFIVLYYAHYGFGLEFRIGKTPELVAMEKSASQIQITTGRETARRQNDFHHALGMPVYAEIMLDYTPVDNHTKSEVIKEIAQDLENFNFKQERLYTSKPDYFHGVLSQKSFNIVVSVIGIEDENIVRVYFSSRST